MAKKIDVGGELNSTALDKKLVDAAQVKDSSRGEKTLVETNEEIEYLLAQEDERQNQFEANEAARQAEADKTEQDRADEAARTEAERQATFEANEAERQVLYEKVAKNTEGVELLNANTGVSEYPEFSEAKAYAVGDIVLNEGLMYRFVSAHEAGAWDGSQVEAWSERKEITEISLEVRGGTYAENYLPDIASGLRNVSYITGEFVPTESEGHYANEIALDGTELSISVTHTWSFSGDYGFAFLSDNNVLIYGEPTRTKEGITINPTEYIKRGATIFRISVKPESVITIDKLRNGLVDKIESINRNIALLEISDNNISKNIDNIKDIIYTDIIDEVPVDTSAGLRNVSVETGEFVTSTTDLHYANELSLNGTEYSIKFYAWAFISIYGYAYLNDKNELIEGVKTTESGYLTIYPQNAIAKGATKVRISVQYRQTNVIVVTKKEFVTTLNDIVTRLPNYIHYNVIGSPRAYISSTDTTGLSIFSDINAIYSAYDALVSAHPNYFKKEMDIGKDESETYPIQYYTLRMQHPLISDNRDGTGTNQWDDNMYKYRRLLITASVHSNEVYATLGCYLAIKEILESDEEWAMFIKNNFILDIVPCVNPWGYENGKVQNNCNDYNLNRTYNNPNQNEFPQQAENEHIISLVQSLKNKGLVGIIDCHNTGNTSQNVSYMVGKPSYIRWNYYAVLTQQLSSQIMRISQEVWNSSVDNKCHLWNASNNNGQLHQYANDEGLLGCTFEVNIGAKVKGSLLTKTMLINLIQAFGTYEGV